MYPPPPSNYPSQPTSSPPSHQPFNPLLKKYIFAWILLLIIRIAIQPAPAYYQYTWSDSITIEAPDERFYGNTLQRDATWIISWNVIGGNDPTVDVYFVDEFQFFGYKNGYPLQYYARDLDSTDNEWELELDIESQNSGNGFAYLLLFFSDSTSIVAIESTYISWEFVPYPIQLYHDFGGLLLVGLGIYIIILYNRSKQSPNDAQKPGIHHVSNKFCINCGFPLLLDLAQNRLWCPNCQKYDFTLN